MRRFLLSILAVALITSTAAAGALDDPRVQEVLTMTAGGLSEAVILAEVADIGSFPELGAADLVALKKAGVPESVLIRMIDLEEPAPEAPRDSRAAEEPQAPRPAAAPHPAEPIRQPAEDAGRTTALLRVEAQRSFWITFYEVAVDGEIVKTAGRLWDEHSEPGQKLVRPPRVKKADRFTTLELQVAPGEHEVAVGFAVTLVTDDTEEQDEWGAFAREHHVNRGVRALPSDAAAHPGEWGEASSVKCQVEAGATCTVVATLERRSPTRFGGIPEYGVTYRIVDR